MNRVKILFKHKEDLIDIELKISGEKLICVFRDRKKQETKEKVLGNKESELLDIFNKDPIGLTTNFAKIYINKNFKPEKFKNFKVIDIDTRGGKRENSGRKKKPNKVKTSISIEDYIYEYISEYADDTFSGNLEEIIKGVMDNE